MYRRTVIMLSGLLVVGVCARPSQAAPIVGEQVFAPGGDVLVTFLGYSASFTNDLYLFDASDLSTPLPVTSIVGPGYAAPGLVFTNQTTAVGTTLNLGHVAAGTELVFGIYVRETGRTYFTGPGARNPDGVAHAVVDNGLPPQYLPYGPVPPGMFAVGFEDIFGGGDLDYNDLAFAFGYAPAAVPEPAALGLLTLGAVAAAVRRRRHSKRR